MGRLHSEAPSPMEGSSEPFLEESLEDQQEFPKQRVLQAKEQKYKSLQGREGSRNPKTLQLSPSHCPLSKESRVSKG